ncbi:hypothetical protein [Streptomyces sp. NBC_01233]|uniref:hypothetical protein n=1 Tax=Streptomyces sp. NBC_01233 TaxID=2903787 RepID=UPI002E1292EF|nr:hypothetical protein OG332_00110 [Streptomyces sp. NBC_01233]
MSASEMGCESMGEESAREPAGPARGPAPRRRGPVGRRLAGRVVEELAVAVAQAVVSMWAPDWSETVRVLTVAVRADLRPRRGRGGRPRG